MNALDEPALVPEVQVAPDRRFGDLDFARQVGQGDEPPLLDQVQKLLPALLDEHETTLKTFER